MGPLAKKPLTNGPQFRLTSSLLSLDTWTNVTNLKCVNVAAETEAAEGETHEDCQLGLFLQ